ncbi:hypothetical protein [Pseudomonas citri]|uniref:hypothetical protein n=1 Tax=Pseudomonas citri TaxID=2978349 RepID=UPI0021B65E82|nr:hypothetical protein [Pseudomonas citri]
MFTTYCVASAGGKISCALVEVQPGATLFFLKGPTLHRAAKKAGPYVHCFGAEIFRKAVFIAPKKSKKSGFAEKTDQVQLIRSKLVAPYFVCCIAFAAKVQPVFGRGHRLMAFLGKHQSLNTRVCKSSLQRLRCWRLPLPPQHKNKARA